ncbi:NACHT, LRR and PYD domains-containing protein 3 [Microcaecilia unicolor]|uniref:NACHT, LRR and PYD domains-containing protein 3-like n=1 Tax=Microcaecilia unicolor TaxID=1415580 RepID=A0A6P7WZQ7_9AMPH|nr:NACHT, LRR and PYD domains-containing protein 3-like [Microcaecilia unicolor]
MLGGRGAGLLWREKEERLWQETPRGMWPAQGSSSIMFLKRNREKLIDELADYIDCILDRFLQKELITKDDYEDAAYERGPRKQVRRLLDIIDCRGEELASIFCSFCAEMKEKPCGKQRQVVQGSSSEYFKLALKHKQTLLRRNDCMKYYNSRHGEKIYFADHFVNLLLIKGHYSLEIKKHELLTFGQQRIHLQKTAERLEIKTEEIFQKLTDRSAPKKILVSGVAGIGKTVFVQKILYDFSRTQTFDSFDFVIHFTFRDLNLVSKPTTLRNLILMKMGHLSRVLDDVFLNSEHLLIILDGFDEFKFYNQIDVDRYVIDPDDEVELVQILGSLLNGELLPESTILLTSRPTVINHIPVDCIERFVIITGFSEKEVKDYFLKYFQTKEQGSEMFTFVRENHFLFTLCYIPAFCWIVCSVLKESKNLNMDQPKTVTDIYSHYLIVILKHHTHNSNKCSTVLETILDLGKLAYSTLLKHETVFYMHDLEPYTSNDLMHSFLDKTSVQNPESTEDVFSFTHFTVQEFFAALYYALEENLSVDMMELEVQIKFGLSSGSLDLFLRFLSGILSARNQKLLLKHLNLKESIKLDSYASWLIEELIKHCENGAYILNLLHCLFEQQENSLASRIVPTVMRLNLSDNTFSPIDFSAVDYFCSLVHGDILELDLTATNINSGILQELEPILFRCVNLWIGENNLDTEAVKILCHILSAPNCKMQFLGMGWTNIGDEALLELYNSLVHNTSLQELWIEGNEFGYDAVEKFSEISLFNSTLQHAIIIGSKIQESEIIKLRAKSSGNLIISDFNDASGRDFWEGWFQWIFQRCEICTDEKLVSFLTKVCRGLSLCQGTDWACEWYAEMAKLLQKRMQHCLVDNVKRRMHTLEQIFSVPVVNGKIQLTSDT